MFLAPRLFFFSAKPQHRDAMEGRSGGPEAESSSARASLLGSGDEHASADSPHGMMEDAMVGEVVVEGPVQNLDQFFMRVRASVPLKTHNNASHQKIIIQF